MNNKRAPALSHSHIFVNAFPHDNHHALLFNKSALCVFPSSITENIKNICTQGMRLNKILIASSEISETVCGKEECNDCE